ncbi:MAG: hypothetical protein WA902_17885 [Thermosynechococcaceae cyanobacterium]
MSHQQDWQFSTVQDFLRQCNWQGTKLPQLPTPSPSLPQDSSVPQSYPQSESWQCQKVQAFLGQGNWDGRPQPISVSQVSLGSPETQVETYPVTLTSTLPVNQFFEFFTWEAQPEIAAIPKLNSPDTVTNDSDLNLSDLSDLF